MKRSETEKVQTLTVNSKAFLNDREAFGSYDIHVCTVSPPESHPLRNTEAGSVAWRSVCIGGRVGGWRERGNVEPCLHRHLSLVTAGANRKRLQGAPLPMFILPLLAQVGISSCPPSSRRSTECVFLPLFFLLAFPPSVCDIGAADGY